MIQFQVDYIHIPPFCIGCGGIEPGLEGLVDTITNISLVAITSKGQIIDISDSITSAPICDISINYTSKFETSTSTGCEKFISLHELKKCINIKNHQRGCVGIGLQSAYIFKIKSENWIIEKPKCIVATITLADGATHADTVQIRW
jgi:hypothetical protein